jgi:uncharacterized protein YgiM (DUF1202 family)
MVLVFLWGSAQAAQMGLVVENVRANVRSGKSEGYRVVATLAPGTSVEVLETQGGFAKVKTADGKTGWMAARLLKITEAAAPAADNAPAATAVSELETARNQARAAEAEAASARLEASRRDEQLAASRRAHLWFALGGLAVGFLLGMLVRELQYRRRLHGLRV